MHNVKPEGGKVASELTDAEATREGLPHCRPACNPETEMVGRAFLAAMPDRAMARSFLPDPLCHQPGGEQGLIEFLRRLADLSPDDPQLRSHLAAVLMRTGRADEALDHLLHVIRLLPDDARSHNNVGVTLEALGRLSQAEAAYREAMRIKACYAEPNFNLGNVLRKRGALEEALAQYRRALELDPEYAGAAANAAALCRHLGRAGETAEFYRKLVALRPRDAHSHSSLLFNLHYVSGMGAEQLFGEHVTWGERHAAPLRGTWRPHDNVPVPSRPLRVGYVSPNFSDHPVSRFLLPVLRSHDHQHFHIRCYSGGRQADAITRRVRESADSWCETGGLSDDQLAAQIRHDSIDILVDLSGHMAHHRLLAFAQRPAPVQVTYLGYPDTTGVPGIDYRLTDSIHDPPGLTERFHTEQLVRLGSCCWCYEPDDEGPEPTDVPPTGRDGGITFASLNTMIKVTPSMARAWIEILHAVPDSTLLLLSDVGPAGAETVQQLFPPQDIDHSRLATVPRTSRRGYLATFRRVDVVLDAYPYNGHTTTCDALWMGVPVVTLSGSTHVTRAGLNLLTQVGLRELAFDSIGDYVEGAITLARDRARLAELHATLRQRVRHSALSDAAGLTGRLERAYRAMWTQWCAHQSSGATV